MVVMSKDLGEGNRGIIDCVVAVSRDRELVPRW